MNPQDPLAQLHPLRDPELIGWWPLAPGWWVLIALLLCALLLLAWWAFKRYQARTYRRQGLEQLELLQQTYQQDKNLHAYVEGINSILKSAALRAYPAREIAGVSGKPWLAFLNAQMPSQLNFEEGFAHAAYSPGEPAVNASQLHQCASTWIKRHRRPA